MKTTPPNMALICVPSITVPNFLSPKILIILRKNERSKEEIKSKSREMESVNSSNIWESL
jgi:hypothetical protein